MAPKKALLALRFPADPRRLRNVRERVQVVAEHLGCSKKHVTDLVLAVNEACMNIIQHAYKGDKSGQIELEVRRDGGQIHVVLTDFAAPVEFRKIRPRALHELRPGGLGTYFMQASVDECSYGHLDGKSGNFVRMIKNIN
ncbi:MAG: ATP-binding protein [Gammaproteobacteria bacterium]|nr:ATP-binding protein [Gammaproteobacteria bacterium]